jgi:SanA protein
VNPVRKYLLASGIPDADIYLDHAGFDTYSTMYRARDIFQVTSVIISTQGFHLPRAIFIARSLGLEAEGIVAPGGDEGEQFLKNYSREIFANMKAVLNLATFADLNFTPSLLFL